MTSAIYLFDTNRHIIFHLYDDRGLDVAAIDRETLLPLYYKYNSWILDYDRPKIEELFEGYSPRSASKDKIEVMTNPKVE